MTRKKCEIFDFSQIGQVRYGNDASFAAEQLCHRGQFIFLLLKIDNIIREMVHTDIDIFHQKTPFLKMPDLGGYWTKVGQNFISYSLACL